MSRSYLKGRVLSRGGRSMTAASSRVQKKLRSSAELITWKRTLQLALPGSLRVSLGITAPENASFALPQTASNFNERYDAYREIIT